VSGPGSSSPEPVTFPANEPMNVTAVAQPGEAVVSWTPPQNYGSVTITSYVASDGSGQSCTYIVATPETDTCTVAFLTNGDSYSFSVTAVNAVGSSIASLAAPSVTPATVPDAPTNVTVTNVTASVSNGLLDVAWNPPDTNGGSPITSYTATDSNGHNCTYVVSSPETDTCTVSNLTLGASYSFSVTAVNSVGTSAASSPSSSATPATVPNAPTGVTATNATTSTSNGAIRISWSPPTLDGGSPITSYTASSSNGGSCSYTVSSPEADNCTVSDLQVGTSYSFTVTGTNALGTSSSSDASNSVAALPPLPSGVTVSFARGSKTLNTTSIKSLHALCAKLVSGALVVVTGYAKSNAALARSRALAVKNLMVGRVAIHVTIKTNTQVARNSAVITATKQ